MLVKEKLNQIEQIVSDIAQKEGCRLYDLEFVGSGKGRTLRIYIDKEAQGVGIDDCVHVTRALNLCLDENEDIIPGGSYQLEVSSPGVDRNLKKDWHFVQAIGQKAFVNLNKSLGEMGITEKRWEKCKKTEVLIKSVDGDKVAMELEGGILIQIPLSVIDKAKVVFELEKSSKKNQ